MAKVKCPHCEAITVFKEKDKGTNQTINCLQCNSDYLATKKYTKPVVESTRRKGKWKD